jgi:hemolysin activation/secretion protein
VVCVQSFAADLPDHPNQQAPAAPKPLPGNVGEGFELPPVAPPTDVVTPGVATIHPRRFVFRGNTVIPTYELERIAAAYVDRDLSVADLEELRIKLTRHYIDRGYITSGAVLRPDAIAIDAVTYDLVEGKLSSVRIKGQGRLQQRYIIDRLVKYPEAPVNIEQLRDRFQRLLEDPLFEKMNARLVPDARLGEAILDVDVARARPYQITLFANNYRAPSIGGSAYGITGMVRNLTGLGDQLEITSSTATNSSAGGRASLSWRVPLNAWGTALSLQADQGRSSVVEESLRSLEIKSQLTSRDVGLSQVAWENLRHRVTFGLNYVQRKNVSTLLGEPFSFSPGEVDGVTKVTAWRLWQDYTFRDEKQALGVRSTFTFAHSNLRPLTGLSAGSPQVDPDYSLWLGQVQYVRQVGASGAQVIARWTMQASRNNIASLDRIAIGGAYTVRGYLENTLVRDTGNILNLEYNYPLVRNSGKGFNLTLIPFYDRGVGRNRDQSADVLSSRGLAMRMTWQGFALDLALASRLVHPSTLATTGNSLQGHGIHVQLSYNVF